MLCFDGVRVVADLEELALKSEIESVVDSSVRALITVLELKRLLSPEIGTRLPPYHILQYFVSS